MEQELTQHITQIALSKFVQFGIRSISIDDICNEMRISKKTFYRVFPRKEDLVEEVLRYQTKMLKDGFDKLHRNKNAIDALVLIIKEMKRYSHNDLSAFYYDLEKYYPFIFSKYQESKMQWIRDSFEANLRQGIAEGYYREDLDIEMGSVFNTVQLNSMKKTLELFPKITFNRLTQFYIDVLVRLITNEKGLKYIEEHTK